MLFCWLSFVEGGYTINQHNCKHNLYQKMLFTKANHGDSRLWFWMDLVLAKLANKTLNITFVPRLQTLPALLDSVEGFWAALNKAVYDQIDRSTAEEQLH